MTTLVENPLPIIFLGIAAEFMLAVAFLNTRQRGFAWAMLSVLIVVLAGVGLELLVVTDVERVEDTLYGLHDFSYCISICDRTYYHIGSLFGKVIVKKPFLVIQTGHGMAFFKQEFYQAAAGKTCSSGD